MTLLDPMVESGSGPTGSSAAGSDAEALIKEASRLQRRRRIVGSVLAALAAGLGIAGYIAASGPPSRSHLPSANGASTPRTSSPSAQTVPLTRSPDFIQPTTLATLPDGSLLILDSSRDQILELRRGGALSVFAGDGRLGFSGDGGPARDAALDFTYFSSASVAVRPGGTVDVLDDGNCRIRAISPAGIIRTVLRVPRVRLSPQGSTCPITSFAISPAGGMYVATDSQVERVSASGQLVWVAGAHTPEARVPAHLTPADVVFSPVSLAFDRAGDLDIASVSPKAVFQLTPAGALIDLGVSYPTQLASDAAGSVLVGTHFGVIQRATATGLSSFDSVVPARVSGLHWGRDGGFQENGIAVTRDGTVYVDNAQGNGYGAATVLVRVTPTRHAALVPVRSSLAATLPRVGAVGFPTSLYPPVRASLGPALSSCPSDAGLERFAPGAVARATTIAQAYSASQFASDIAVTDRSWWAADFNAFAGDNLGTHAVTGEVPTARTSAAGALTAACGLELVADSIAVTVSRSAYSDFAATLYFLDRDGHPFVFDVRR